jgi:hypothetical protein
MSARYCFKQCCHVLIPHLCIIRHVFEMSGVNSITRIGVADGKLFRGFRLLPQRALVGAGGQGQKGYASTALQ